MAIETWMSDIEAAIVTAFQADTALTGYFGKIEGGLLTGVPQQALMGQDLPYCGVVVERFDPDEDDIVHVKRFRVHVVCNLMTIKTPEVTAKQDIQKALSEIDVAVGRQRTGNMFSVSDTQGQIDDVFPGAGRILATAASKDRRNFAVFAEYAFAVKYKLLLT